MGRFLRLLAGIPVLILLAPPVLRAQTACGDLPRVQREDCMETLQERADADLDQTMAALMSSADNDQRDELVRSQSAWKSYVDAQCALEGAQLERSQRWQAISACHLDRTRRRLAEFSRDSEAAAAIVLGPVKLGSRVRRPILMEPDLQRPAVLGSCQQR
jgi:uncharacterized protein YecT (DUF1311 family)